MKTIKTTRLLMVIGTFLGAMMMCSVGHAQGFTGLWTNTYSWTNTFPTGGATTNFQDAGMNGYILYWDNLNSLTVQGDPTMNASGTSASNGACEVIATFGSAGSQAQFFYDLHMTGQNADTGGYIALTNISELAFDIFVSNSTPVTAGNGLYGQLELGFSLLSTPSSGFWSADDVGASVTIPASALGNWVHITNGGTAWNTQINDWIALGYNYACAVLFIYNNWGNSTGISLPVTSTFWIDNLTVVQPQINVVIPPPTLGIVPAVPGLTIFAAEGATSGGIRENIKNPDEFSWVNGPFPVSYSFTVNSWPVPKGDLLSANIWLIQNPGNETSPGGYNEANAVQVSLSSLAAGGVSFGLSFKTNATNSYMPAAMASVTNTNAIGTWTLTFNSATNFTLSGPGVSTNANIPDPQGNIASAFASGVTLYFGTAAANTAGCNDHVSFSDMKVTSLPNAFDDDFADDGPYLNVMWANVANNTQCIQQVATTSTCWVYWTEPATGFGLCVTPALRYPITNSVWTKVQINSPINVSTNYYQLVDQYDLPGYGASPGYFTVINP